MGKVEAINMLKCGIATAPFSDGTNERSRRWRRGCGNDLCGSGSIWRMSNPEVRGIPFIRAYLTLSTGFPHLLRTASVSEYPEQPTRANLLAGRVWGSRVVLDILAKGPLILPPPPPH